MTDEKTWLEKRREALAPKSQRPEPEPDTLVMATIESQAEDTAPEGDQPLAGEGEDETGLLIGDPEAVANALLAVLNGEPTVTWIDGNEPESDEELGTSGVTIEEPAVFLPDDQESPDEDLTVPE